jgi:hypothetical protein
MYANGASGNVAPIATISGANTGLSFPRQLTLDATGNIFVANENGGGACSVTAYHKTDTGNAVPFININGSNTGLAAPQAVAVDSAGNVYVTNFGGAGQSVTEYAPGATGNVTPIATIQGASTGLNGPVGITVVRTAPANPGPTCTQGTSICLIGRNIPGSINVPAGQSLVLINSTVGGSVNASNPASITVCNTTVNGSVNISGASGFVLLGDPGDDNCPGNSFGSTVYLANDHGGVEVSHNQHIGGSLILSGDSGSPLLDDAHPEVEANVISGSLSCSGDSPPASNDGQHNTVSGTRTGECAGF